MARPVKMTVNNFTNKVLKFKSKNAEHGKFTSDPPSEIQGTGSWACSTVSGGTIGPKGTVVYEAADKSFKVTFFYNHPYGPATSSYRVTGDPSNAFTYEIKGDFEGHDQKITFELYAI